MVIDGTIRGQGARYPTTTKIRILHQDSTLDRTVQFYDPQGYRFGVRLTSQDGFLDGERILMRIVVSAQDSFMARYVGPTLLFRGITEPTGAPTTRIELFRNALPTVYRMLRDTSIRETQLLRYRLVAVDPDADTVVYAMANPPEGATLDRVTGLFSWRPGYEQSGTYRIRFLISDGFDTDDSRVTTVVVRNVNRPPRFTEALRDTSIRENDTLRLRVMALDPDGDRILLHPLLIPPGMTVDSLQRSITWVPTFDQAGRYAMRFVITDGALTDTSTTAGIEVTDVDRPPYFVSFLHDTTITEGQSLVWVCTGEDPDGDTVRFSLIEGPVGSSLDSTGVFRWTPTFTQAGDYTIRARLQDRILFADTVVHIRVMNKNRPPGEFDLRSPPTNDTVRLVLSTPIRFGWARPVDPDSGDHLRYFLHVWGPRLDTVYSGETDTTVLLNLKPLLVPTSAYHWSVSVSDGELVVASRDTFAFRTTEGIIGTAELLSAVPKSYDLEQSLPDPFNPMTTIRYALPERSYVRLTIFNLLGEPILVLVSGEKDAGVYDVTFDVSDFTNGAYMFRLDAHPLVGSQTKDFVNTKKMFIVH